MKAKKSFGQHFLVNDHISARIADALTNTSTDRRVLEVGPGKGMLTKHLLSRYDLKVVELDRDMVDYLKHNFPDLENKIISLDFLKLDLTKVFNEKPFLLIGNYPYNISSQIVFKMLDNRQLIPEMVGMFQKEVAERIVAPPGTKTYGVISVLVQAYYHGEYLFKVSPGSFNPPPKVMSAVIRLKRKEKLSLECNEKRFKTVVKICFGQRRKMIRNTLKSLISDSELLKDDLFSKRPEQLALEDFIKITKIIDSQNS